MIPIAKPYLTDKDYYSLREVIKSGWVMQGEKVKEFEKLIANYVNTKYAIATSSCTAALHLALLLSGIQEGEEVITPSFTFVATVNSILYVQGKPVFCDIAEDTYNIDVNKIEELINEKTKAIVVVHQFGLPAEMNKIIEIAKKYNLKIIEDAACALGAEYNHKKVGSLSQLTCFSFHPRKVITTGEGGMITTNNRKLRNLAQSMRSHGVSIFDIVYRKTHRITYEKYNILGYNYRMTDIQAQLGIEQFKKLKLILDRRREIANYYNEVLQNIEEVKIPVEPLHTIHTYQSYLIRLTKKCRNTPSKIIKEMLNKGICCRRSFLPVHLQPYYIKKVGRIKLEITEKVFKNSLFLPIYTELTKSQQRYIITSLKKAVISK